MYATISRSQAEYYGIIPLMEMEGLIPWEAGFSARPAATSNGIPGRDLVIPCGLVDISGR